MKRHLGRYLMVVDLILAVLMFAGITVMGAILLPLEMGLVIKAAAIGAVLFLVMCWFINFKFWS